MLVRPGDPFDPARLDRSLKTLYATGLFQDVSLTRQGDTLVVTVVENPLVNRVAFEDNHLRKRRPVAAGRAAPPARRVHPGAAEADRQRILDVYAKRGRFATVVTPQIIRLSQNRVDVVFQINDGPSAFISHIAFVGNHAFSESRLQDVINTREQTWWRFLSTLRRVRSRADQLRQGADPPVLPEERLCRLRGDRRGGRTGARSLGVLPDLHHPRGRALPGGKVIFNAQLRDLDGKSLRKDLQFDEGDWYDGDAVGRTARQDRSRRARARLFLRRRQARGHPPSRQAHHRRLIFDVNEGPRVYVERIDIVGNMRTKDKVIRREFRLAEGDAFSAEAVRRSRQRLQDLGYFNTVTIQPSPGSAPDKTRADHDGAGEGDRLGHASAAATRPMPGRWSMSASRRTT